MTPNPESKNVVNIASAQQQPHAPPPLPAAPPEAPKPGSRRPFAILAGVVTLMGGSIGGYAVMTANEEATDDAQVEADVVAVGARVGGQVLKVPVKENTFVKKGELLLEIDAADYQARVKQSEAEVTTSKAQAAQADAQVAVVEASARGGLSTAKAVFSGSNVAVAGADAQIAAAKATVARAEADVRRTDLDLQRQKELRAANAVPQERLDNAQAASDSAKAQLLAAQAQMVAAVESRHQAESRVAEAKGRLDQSSPIDAQIAAAHASADLAHARVQSAEAALELAQNQLAYTKVTAPADGFVSKLAVHEGQLLQPGQSIAELVPQETYVIANFKETQVGRIKPGQEVEISIDAFTHHKLKGKVESLSGGTGARFSLLPPDNASGNFVKVVQRVPVRIAWTDVPKDLVLRAGLSADVTVKVSP
jgi:membrane fusion protein (multidrug efflux system)